VTEFDRLNHEHFNGDLPSLPMVIGITPYGRCIGQTRHRGEWGDELPRITIASNLFQRGTDAVRDTVLHEMIHAKLILDGQDSSHNGQPWCDEIARLSPAILGREIKAVPIRPKRIDGKVKRYRPRGHLTQAQLATWPGHRRGGQILEVSSS
jgi:hypothetical protein